MTNPTDAERRAKVYQSLCGHFDRRFDEDMLADFLDLAEGLNTSALERAKKDILRDPEVSGRLSSKQIIAELLDRAQQICPRELPNTEVRVSTPEEMQARLRREGHL